MNISTIAVTSPAILGVILPKFRSNRMSTMLWVFSIFIDQWYSKGRICEFCNYSKEKQILFVSFFPDTNLVGGTKTQKNSESNNQALLLSIRFNTVCKT